jgi:hypothetical protein
MDDREEKEAIALLQRRRVEAEIANLRASRRKATAEAAKAEYEVTETRKQRNFFERVLSTTQATVALALITLVFQIAQFAYTSREERKAEESKEWKETVMKISFKGDATSVASALAAKTFFTSSAYRADALKVTADIVPFLDDDDAFKQIFESLLSEASPPDDTEAYEAAQAVSSKYQAIANKFDTPAGIKSVPVAALCDDDLSDILQKDPFDLDEKNATVVQADRRDDQVDLLTHSLTDSWHKLGTGPIAKISTLERLFLRYGPEDGTDSNHKTVDLSGLSFQQANFTGAYLCRVNLRNATLQNAVLDGAVLRYADLAGTHLENASVNGTDLGSVTSFTGSHWDGVQWWTAASLSPQLCAWLPGPDGKQAGAVAAPGPVKACQPG